MNGGASSSRKDGDVAEQRNPAEEFRREILAAAKSRNGAASPLSDEHSNNGNEGKSNLSSSQGR
jgi:hypothetical protein